MSGKWIGGTLACKRRALRSCEASAMRVHYSSKKFNYTSSGEGFETRLVPRASKPWSHALGPTAWRGRMSGESAGLPGPAQTTGLPEEFLVAEDGFEPPTHGL
jgi:hypothetical protein